MIQYVVFDTATGAPVKWGQCQPELLDAQAGPGERALATSALTVNGNRSIILDKAWIKRESVIEEGCQTPFGLVDTTPFSISRLTSVVAGANAAHSLNVPFSVNFTMKDRTRVPLNAVETMTMGLTVMAFVSACHDRFSQLEDTINSAPDMAALLAIDITTGWPL